MLFLPFFILLFLPKDYSILCKISCNKNDNLFSAELSLNNVGSFEGLNQYNDKWWLGTF